MIEVAASARLGRLIEIVNLTRSLSLGSLFAERHQARGQCAGIGALRFEFMRISEEVYEPMATVHFVHFTVGER
jgi:hypothetical protein